MWPAWALGEWYEQLVFTYLGPLLTDAFVTPYAIACPAGNQRNNLKRSKTSIPSKAKGAGAECFKCGKEGHYSKGEVMLIPYIRTLFSLSRMMNADCPDPGFSTGPSRGSGRKASSSRGTSRSRGRGGKKAVSKPRSKPGAFKAADDDWDWD